VIGKRLGLVSLLAVGVAGCADDDRPATFDYIHPAIIVANCTTSACHVENNAEADFYNFSDRESACADLSKAKYRPDPDDPGSPSRLFLLLTGDYPNSLTMPPDRRLPDPDIELIERWMQDGGSCD